MELVKSSGVAVRGAAAPEGMEIGKDFPMVCENCLGDSRFLRMSRLPTFEACKITGRPFQPFRWRPGRNLPPIQTIVCYEIAAEKNVCQACLNDMDYNIPMALRDAFEASIRQGSLEVDLAPKSEINQAFHFNQKLANLQKQQGGGMASSYRLLDEVSQVEYGHKKIVEDKKVKLPSLCVGWLKGGCNRDSCNYRPCCGAFAFPESKKEFPEATSQLVTELQEKGAQFVRVQDNALRSLLLKSAKEEIRKKREQALQPPNDQTVTTLFLAGVPEKTSENEVRSVFTPFGKLSKVQILHGKGFGFVQFDTRLAAETCIKQLGGRVHLQGKQINLGWAEKKKDETAESSSHSSSSQRDAKNGGDKSTATQETRKETLNEVEVEEEEDDEEGEQRSGPPMAQQLPEILPGIPVPFGMKAGEVLPEPSEGLINLMKRVHPNWKERTMPPKNKRPKAPELGDLEVFYPSLLPQALEGNLPPL